MMYCQIVFVKGFAKQTEVHGCRVVQRLHENAIQSSLVHFIDHEHASVILGQCSWSVFSYIKGSRH